MKNILALLTLLTLVVGAPTMAHVKLIQTEPSENAMLSMSPKSLTLEFNKKVSIIKVTLKNTQGEKTKFGFKPSKSPKSNFQWPLPSLKADSYSVEVIYLGSDGHKMKEQYSFMVH